MIDFGVINNAIELSKRLGEVAKQVNNAEITSIAANLMLELAETKMALANAKTEQQGLIEEIVNLQKEQHKNYYEQNQQFGYEGSEIRYCTKCYDTTQRRITIFENEGIYYCPVCLDARRSGRTVIR